MRQVGDEREEEEIEELGKTANQLKRIRFLPLDVLRGMCICFMILQWQVTGLEHSKWHGYPPAELIFPTFLFAVGNSIDLSSRTMNPSSSRRWNAMLNIVRRSAILFSLGYLMQWYPFVKVDLVSGAISPYPIGETRILGVLQRIALCYLIVASLIQFCRSIIVLGVISAVVLLAYWPILWFFGDKAGHGPYSLDGNAVLKLDVWLLGRKHILVERGILFDNEGLLSTLPATVSTLGGYLAWRLLKPTATKSSLPTYTLTFGISLLFIFISIAWSYVFPINKKLWTSSFALLSLGLDIILLLSLLFVDKFIALSMTNVVSKHLQWICKHLFRFFYIFGQNSLFIFISAYILINTLNYFPAGGSGLSVRKWIDVEVFECFLPESLSSIPFSLISMLFFWTVAWFMNRHNIFIKV